MEKRKWPIYILIVAIAVVAFAGYAYTKQDTPAFDIIVIGICPNCGKPHVVSIIPRGYLNEEHNGVLWRPVVPKKKADGGK